VLFYLKHKLGGNSVHFILYGESIVDGGHFGLGEIDVYHGADDLHDFTCVHD
jgi:hypothetical protein